MKHNYRNYSKPVDEAVPTEAVDEVKEVIAEAAANVEVDVDEAASVEAPVQKTATTEATVIGKVVKCKRLNVRKNPSKESDPVCIVNEGTVLMVDRNATTPSEWYAVYTESGIKGFCMKEFVKISK